MTRACDLIVSGGLFFLLLFTPFAFGTVHPWAYMAMESAIFLLVAVALAKLIYLRRWPVPLRQGISRLALPLGLFLGLIVCQVVPLPPALLHFLSPQTYQLYQTSLPGWPDKLAYADLLKLTPSQPLQPRLLPTPEQLRQTTDPRRVERRAVADEKNHPLISAWKGSKFLPRSWRPLSIAPSLTFTDLNKFLAYGALFFLLLLYPFGAAEASGSPPAGHRPGNQIESAFLRSLVLVLLAGASLVALVGIVQLFAGNGKILWLFVPYDWDGPVSGVPQRASGPFVNPDHFANYLALIFPFAIALAVKPRAWFAPRIANAARLYCATGAAVIFMAILLSLSRFGWLSALLGSVLVFFISQRTAPARRIIYFRWRTLATVGYTAAVICLLAVTIWLIGPQARQAIDHRLADTVTGDGGLTTRLSIWRDALPMIRDFPLLGTGLGTWSDLFPRYQSPSAAEIYFREAHNDYLELLAETGFSGFILLALFFIHSGRLIVAGLRAAPENLQVILAPSLAALVIMALHEGCDFSLQIPANALLFTLLLGMSLRLAVKVLARTPMRDHEMTTWLPASGIALAMLLGGLSFTQDWLPYPYNLGAPTSVAEAAERIDAHPGQAAGHAMIAMLMADRAPLNRQIEEYAIAARLQPNDPRLRDLYASALLRQGERAQGLSEIRRSVALAPYSERHFYLNDKVIAFLLDDERRAIEAGFQQAIAGGDLPATNHLALFYEKTGQWLAQAKLLESRASGSTRTTEKLEFILQAGQRYAVAGELAKAEASFIECLAIEPQDPRAYQALALSVYAPQGKVEPIAAIIAKGIANRAEPVPLYLALAEAMKATGSADRINMALDNAEKNISQTAARGGNVLPLYLALADSARRIGRRDRERAALERAMELRPYARDILQPLGNLYFATRQFDRAALVFARLTAVQPNSAAAFHQLGRAEEERYGFAAAAAAYARAVALAPDNASYRERHETLKAQLAANRRSP